MRQGAVERPDNVLNIPHPGREAPRPQETRPHETRSQEAPAQRSGQAIISMLQQAADVARRNEERAKAQALHLVEELRIAEERYRAMEARARHYEARASEAEAWLVRIHDEVQERLLIPLSGEGPQEAARRR
jgi:hypothetical protein